jgi:Family of unknown function (DUF6498)
MHRAKKKKWDAERLQTLARIGVANGLLIFSAFYSDWTLREVTLAYAGELLILVLLVYARLLSATRLPPRWLGKGTGPWRLILGKLFAILLSLPLYALVVGLIVLLLFGDFRLSLPEATWRALALTWLVFLASHLIDFIYTVKTGAYDELISDSRVMTPMWRYPVMLVAAIAVTSERDSGATIVPWFFIFILALMAIINSASQVLEMDAVRASVKSGRPDS